jgi:hypothetical protein
VFDSSEYAPTQLSVLAAAGLIREANDLCGEAACNATACQKASGNMMGSGGTIKYAGDSACPLANTPASLSFDSCTRYNLLFGVGS